MMLGTSAFGRMILKFVWCMTREDALEYQAAAFEPIPPDFSGKLLEIPVGTGVISMPVFKTMPKADITCVDYSEKMMESAEKRAREMDIKNIRFQQGDVGDLPFPDNSFDAMVSLNGFRAFPNKEAAYRETFRVLKPGGIFTGCFYVPSGFFTPPFETKESLQTRLDGMYSEAEVLNVQSIAVFRCRK